MANMALAQLTSTLLTRFDIPPGFRERQMREPFSTGNLAVDRLLRGGLPRAALSEICGGPSSSRTAFLVAVLVRALKAGECCVWIDSSGTFDPGSAATAGLPLDRLLWINCRGQVEHALKATDLLIHGGGFGLVILDLADIAEATLRRIAMTSWFRLRRAAEETGSALIVLTSIPQTRSCSTVHIELKRQKSLWRGKLLRGVSSHLETFPTRKRELRRGALMFCCLYAPGNLPVLLDCARHFSPLIEEHPDMVVFDIRSLGSLHGPPASVARAIARQIGIPARVAIASNPDAAIHAARGLDGTTVIEPGQEAAVLSLLSIHLLGGSQDAARSLDLWGIRTFGAFAALPASSVAARLGTQGIALQRLARGEGYRRLRTQDDPPSFGAEMELDSPVELLESLCFVLGRLLEEVLAKLSHGALSTNEIRVTLNLERAPEHMATLRLPVPMSDAQALLKMLHLLLAENPPSQAVVKVRLDAEPVRPRRTQHGLFAALPPEAERLETTLARVRHLVGSQNVGSPQLVDTHRPDSFVMRPFAPPQLSLSAANGTEEAPLRLCLRRFRPPSYAHVLLSSRRPVHVSATAATGRIAMAKGPWRVSGDWWDDHPWQRDRWDVALDSGILLRIFEQPDSGRWFIEGSYD